MKWHSPFTGGYISTFRRYHVHYPTTVSQRDTISFGVYPSRRSSNAKLHWAASLFAVAARSSVRAIWSLSVTACALACKACALACLVFSFSSVWTVLFICEKLLARIVKASRPTGRMESSESESLSLSSGVRWGSGSLADMLCVGMPSRSDCPQWMLKQVKRRVGDVLVW